MKRIPTIRKKNTSQPIPVPGSKGRGSDGSDVSDNRSLTVSISESAVCWNREEVIDWICSIDYAEYIEFFKEKKITGKMLLRMNDKRLMALGIEDMFAREGIMDQIDELKQNADQLLYLSSGSPSSLELQLSPTFGSLSFDDSRNMSCTRSRRDSFDTVHYIQRHNIPIVPDGQITIRGELGLGSFSVVYLGSWNGCDVAIKVINPKFYNDQTVMEEAYRNMTLSQHQHVVGFAGIWRNPTEISKFCSFRHENQWSLVIHCMHNNSLEYYLQARTEFSELSVVQHLIDASAGLYHLHANDYIHRDIAARNFLVSDESRVFISDFGMSRMEEDVIDTSRDMIGAFRWMAPETFRNGAFTKKSDIFSFGIFIWEVLHMKIPYSDMKQSPKKIAFMVCNEKLRPTMKEEIRSEYRYIINNCLKSDPSKRPTIDELHEKLTVLKQNIMNEQKTYYRDDRKKSAFSTLSTSYAPQRGAVPSVAVYSSRMDNIRKEYGCGIGF